MIYKKLCLLLAAALFALPSLSQENFLLKGIVKADSLPPSNIHIINLTQKTGTTNSIAGKFEIEVKKKDTLLFSALHLEAVEIVVGDEIIEERFIKVQMDEQISELEEVQISNISLTGNLQHDIANIETNNDDFGFPRSPTKPLTSIERKLHTATTGGEIDLLYNLLSGRTAMLKTAKEKEDIVEMMEMARKVFPTSFFEDNLQIPEGKIRTFLYFCTGDPHFRQLMADSKRLELLEYYQKKAVEFLKEKREGLPIGNPKDQA